MTTEATAIAPVKTPQQQEVTKTKRPPRMLTLEQFRRRYSDREDGYKYEFNNGVIEKSLSNMNAKQMYIVKNLNRRFVQTQAFANGDELTPEVEQLTTANQSRRPDLSYWPSSKIKQGDESVSEFVIEIISPTDNYLKVNKKLREYFKAGVKIVWQIVPDEQTVFVYSSPTEVTICEGDKVCSAAPVVPDFSIAAKDIFVK
jgi:Uma2 family endonuclease